MNLVLVTAYYMSWIAVSNGTRAGLILYESGMLPFRSGEKGFWKLEVRLWNDDNFVPGAEIL